MEFNFISRFLPPEILACKSLITVWFLRQLQLSQTRFQYYDLVDFRFSSTFTRVSCSCTGAYLLYTRERERALALFPPTHPGGNAGRRPGHAWHRPATSGDLAVSFWRLVAATSRSFDFEISRTGSGLTIHMQYIQLTERTQGKRQEEKLFGKASHARRRGSHLIISARTFYY